MDQRAEIESLLAQVRALASGLPEQAKIVEATYGMEPLVRAQSFESVWNYDGYSMARRHIERMRAIAARPSPSPASLAALEAL